MINEEKMAFNDLDDEYCEPLLDAWEAEIEEWYERQYSEFDSMMERLKQDIWEQKTYGGIWEAADRFAEEEAYCEALLEEDEQLIDPDSTEDYDWKFQYSEWSSLSYYSAPDGWNTVFKVEDVLGDVWGYKRHYYIEYQSDTHCFVARIEQETNTPRVDLELYKLNGDRFTEIKKMKLDKTNLSIHSFIDIKGENVLPSSKTKFVKRMQHILNHAAFF